MNDAPFLSISEQFSATGRSRANVCSHIVQKKQPPSMETAFKVKFLIGRLIMLPLVSSPATTSLS